MTDWTKRNYGRNQKDLETATSPYIDDNGRVIKQFQPIDPIGVSFGQYDGLSFIAKFGRNPTVASGTQEVIWDQADAVYTYMSSASTLYISSSDNTDDQVYEVQGLDANWALQTVEVTVSGFTFVPLSGTWIRVFRAKNLNGTNSAGDVYIADSNTDGGGDGIPDTASSIKAKVIQGNNQTNMAIYTVPQGRTGYLMDWYISLLRLTGVAAVSADFDIFRRSEGGVFRSTQPIGVMNTGAGDHYYSWPFPLELEARTDIEVRVQPSANADASAGFTVLLRS